MAKGSGWIRSICSKSPWWSRKNSASNYAPMIRITSRFLARCAASTLTSSKIEACKMAGPAPGRARLFAVLGIVVVPLLFHFFIVETSALPFIGDLSIWLLFRTSFITVAAVVHWTIYAGLLLTFAVTLRPGRE